MARRGFRRFHLDRAEDVSGTSGTGVVAEGVLFSTGKAVLAWTTRYRSVAVYDSMAELERIHGHDGRTKVVWVDEADTEPHQPNTWAMWDRVEGPDVIAMDAVEALGEAIEQVPWPPKPGDMLQETRTGHGAVVAVAMWRKGWRIVRRDIGG